MEQATDHNKIVYLFDRKESALPCPIAQLQSYWNVLSENGAPPNRADVDPRRIMNILPHFMLMERIAPGIVRIRVAGSDVSGAVGTDLRGMPLSALFDTEARRRLPNIIETTLNSGSRAKLHLRAKSGLLRRPVKARLSLLPLRGHTSEVTQLMGCLVFEGTPPAPPCRFEIRSTEYEKGQPERTAQTAQNLRLVT